MYVIKRTDQGGGYVAKEGSPCSYTHGIRQMRKYSTIDEANRDRCHDNEIIIPLSELID